MLELNSNAHTLDEWCVQCECIHTSDVVKSDKDSEWQMWQNNIDVTLFNLTKQYRCHTFLMWQKNVCVKLLYVTKELVHYTCSKMQNVAQEWVYLPKDGHSFEMENVAKECVPNVTKHWVLHKKLSLNMKCINVTKKMFLPQCTFNQKNLIYYDIVKPRLNLIP